MICENIGGILGKLVSTPFLVAKVPAHVKVHGKAIEVDEDLGVAVGHEVENQVKMVKPRKKLPGPPPAPKGGAGSGAVPVTHPEQPAKGDDSMATVSPLGGSLAVAEVLRIAHLDAQAAYRDLSGYKITLTPCPDGWHVDYDLTDPLSAGGGPHYVIDPRTGDRRQASFPFSDN